MESDWFEVRRAGSREVTRIPRDLAPEQLAHRAADASAGQGYAHPLAIAQIDAALADGAPCPFYSVAIWASGGVGEYLDGNWKMRHRPRDADQLRTAIANLYEAQTGEKPATVAVDVAEMLDPRDWC